jgi:Flp pilus assembly protein TadG
MIRTLRLLGARRGSAGVEMALVLPLLLGLMCGSVELGNYFLSEHKLLKAVRDGARFASRQSFASYDCADGTVASDVSDATKELVRTGVASGGTDLLANWNTATFEMSVECFSQVVTGKDADGADINESMGGIYSGSTNGAPVVTVTASVPYRPVLAAFGFSGVGLSLNASQQSAVMGI